ncbi:MAG TPA: MBL fold metallo-hydrolase [Bryobacteraceae bacterium]|nr:MBL fold metallo-hydrolase [Bryobacteraceae bacterium]
MYEIPENKRRWSRRILLSTGGMGVVGAGAMIYQAAPGFWQQYTRELRRPVSPSPKIPNPSEWPDQGLHAAWLGHSTVLLKVDGFTIITDPVFSTRAGLHLGPVTLGVKRLTAPALALANLPKIDLVLLSHAHMDHFDLPSLRRLEQRVTTVVTASRTGDLLRVGQYAGVHEIGWGQEQRVGPATIRGLEVNHWGARLRTDTYRGYNGYLIQIGHYRILFAGDTADTTKLTKAAGSKHIDMAIIPIGAYNPWVRFHCTPEQAWRISQEARAELFFPVHHSTFQLSREPVTEPLERLHAAAGSQEKRIIIHEIGQEFKLS